MLMINPCPLRGGTTNPVQMTMRKFGMEGDTEDVGAESVGAVLGT